MFTFYFIFKKQCFRKTFGAVFGSFAPQNLAFLPPPPLWAKNLATLAPPLSKNGK